MSENGLPTTLMAMLVIALLFLVTISVSWSRHALAPLYAAAAFRPSTNRTRFRLIELVLLLLQLGAAGLVVFNLWPRVDPCVQVLVLFCLWLVHIVGWRMTIRMLTQAGVENFKKRWVTVAITAPFGFSYCYYCWIYTCVDMVLNIDSYEDAPPWGALAVFVITMGPHGFIGRRLSQWAVTDNANLE